MKNYDVELQKQKNMTGDEILECIKTAVPGLTKKQLSTAKNYVEDGFLLSTIIEIYQYNQKIKKWIQKPHSEKHYYKVPMLNGGTKYVYMCEEMVQELYGHRGYEKM